MEGEFIYEFPYIIHGGHTSYFSFTHNRPGIIFFPLFKPAFWERTTLFKKTSK
jgi:hypothetical protein